MKYDSGANNITLGTNPVAKVHELMIDSKGRSARCSYGFCDVRTGLKACQGCDKVKYCCTEHSKLDWKYHKDYCVRGHGAVSRKRLVKWMRDFLKDAHDNSDEAKSRRAREARTFNDIQQSIGRIVEEQFDSQGVQQPVARALAPSLPAASAVADAESGTRRTRRVLPNAPCPCGSQAKFKKCCGKGGAHSMK